MSDTGVGGPVADSAYQVLVNLALTCRESARGLPAQIDVKPQWSGVGFELMGRKYVAPMNEVSEMLEVPFCTGLPGVQSWVLGVANVRGRLLPLCDMAAFFGKHLTTQKKQQRVLVLESDDLYTGLLVDRVFGMQHFDADSVKPLTDDGSDPAATFLRGSFHTHDDDWRIFSPMALMTDLRFMNVARHHN